MHCNVHRFFFASYLHSDVSKVLVNRLTCLKINQHLKNLFFSFNIYVHFSSTTNRTKTNIQKKKKFQSNNFCFLSSHRQRTNKTILDLNNMNLSDINPNLPCLRPLTSSQSQRRRMSCSTTSKSTNSSSNSSSNYSKTGNSLPILIQLCIYPNEEYSCETIKTLFSSRQQYSANVADEFGCNLLMYTLRYQRLQLFDYLFNEISLDLDFKAKDRQGNTILHYAIIYASNQTAIFEQLIDKFIQYGIDIDQRNVFGFTPLLLG